MYADKLLTLIVKLTLHNVGNNFLNVYEKKKDKSGKKILSYDENAFDSELFLI